jgi:hypothetical protein
VSEAEAARFKERNAATGHRFAVTHWRRGGDLNPETLLSLHAVLTCAKTVYGAEQPCAKDRIGSQRMLLLNLLGVSVQRERSPSSFSFRADARPLALRTDLG